MKYIFPSPTEEIRETVFWDIYDNARKQHGTLTIDETVVFFKEANRFAKDREDSPQDTAILNESRIGFCRHFFEENKDNADLLRRLAQEPEVNEFLAGAYKTAAKAAFDMDFVDRMNDLSKTYGFVLPTEEEMRRECVELAKKFPMLRKEQLQIVSEVRDLCVKRMIPVTIVSRPMWRDSLVTDISADDCKDETVVDAKVIHAVVTATKQLGILLVCAHLDGKNYVTGWESAMGSILPLEPFYLELYATLFLPVEMKVSGWTCVDSLSALDPGR